jgi:preprotein translocase subunit SecY
MIEQIKKIWKARDLRYSLLFVLLMLAIFRFAAHIPIPGVDVVALRQFFQSNQMLGLLNLFSGGGMENFSIVLMGVGPYITASIVFQLLGMIVPKFEEMNKEESGRQKINSWTRWLTVPLSIVQSYSMILLLKRSTSGIISDMSLLQTVAMIMTITAGTVMLMWFGELINEKKVGNGISIMIFAGIITSLPGIIQRTLATYDPTMLFTIIGFIVVALVTVVGVVIINEGQRKIPVQYARQIRGNRVFGGSSTHLPLRVNMAGVMPIIFALSLVMVPQTVGQFLIHAQSAWIAQAAEMVVRMSNNQLVYAVAYFLLVFGFTFFYTEVVFKPEQIAENLQKQGGFIPGIRPGKHTSDYLTDSSRKVIFSGALFLAAIAVLPLAVRYLTGKQWLAIGGTSILIVVSVVIDMVKQVQAQLSMRDYEIM